jgi:hypothetical protein
METTTRRVKRGVTMKRNILGHSLGTLVLLTAVLLIVHPNIQAAPEADNKEVSQLLEDIKVQSADLQRDSETLESYTRSGVSWQTHAEELNQMKDRINTIGKTISKLQNLRSSASPWQQEAIDRIIPVAEKLASNTSAAIEHLNKNPLKINEPQYQEYIKSNAETSSHLAALVKDFVEYGKTRTMLEAYERKLEVPQ